MKIGDRVKYTGSVKPGLPFKNEIGTITKMWSANGNSFIELTLKSDGKVINLHPSDVKNWPIIAPIAIYGGISILAIALTWRIFR